MSMYLDHYGLREAPFRITPHTDFFFSGANRGATLGALLYAITHDEGIVKVTGEVGSGKTMLCRMLLDKLPETVETIYLANPSLSRDELLFALSDELKMNGHRGRVPQLLRALQQELVDIYASGRQIVVLIDEAHAMPADSLEEIRLLSNLESNRHKLLQIVLFGQPELDDLLAQQNLRQLRERITHNFELEPLRRDDVGTYLMFRLRAAGYHGPDLFSASALKLFAQASGGLTRRLNVLGDKAMLAAFAANQHQVDSKIAKAAIRDASFGRLQGMPQPSRRSLWIGLAAGALGALGVLTGWHVWSGRTAMPAFTAGQVATPPLALAADAVRPAKESPPSSGSPAAPSGQPAADTPLVEQHVGAFNSWIRNASEQHYAIQLARSTGERRSEIETFLRTARGLLPAEELRVYSATADGQQWLGVIYGDFSAYSTAEKRLQELPAALTGHQAFIRPIRQLKPHDMS
jgi:MSHA biogenesis protein MshM